MPSDLLDLGLPDLPDLDVLAERAIRRGYRIRRRRQVLRAMPVVVLAVLAALVLRSDGDQPGNVRTVDRPSEVEEREDGLPARSDAITGAGATGEPSVGGPAASAAAPVSGGAAPAGVLGAGPRPAGPPPERPPAKTPGKNVGGTFFGSGERFDEEPAYPEGKGCVVSAGVGIDVDPTTGSQYNSWNCGYTALAPGGYAAGGAWEMVIRRGATELRYSDRDAPACADTGFVQAGDRVWVTVRVPWHEDTDVDSRMAVGEDHGCGPGL